MIIVYYRYPLTYKYVITNINSIGCRDVTISTYRTVVTYTYFFIATPPKPSKKDVVEKQYWNLRKF